MHFLAKAYAGVRRLASHEFRIFAALLACQVLGIEVAARDITIDASRIDPDELAGVGQRPGDLRYLAGLALASRDADFGGLSGLMMAPDGESLTAVSDRGEWLRMRLKHDEAGRLAGVGEASMAPILGADGRPVADSNHTADSEALARLSNGDVLVAFERHNRVLRFSAGPGMFTARPRRFGFRAASKDFVRARGLEALAILADGGVLIIEEERRGHAADHVGFRIGPGGGTPRRVRYSTLANFKPTGMARLDGDELLVLERRFNVLSGFTSRVARLAAPAGSAQLKAENEILRLQAPGLRDNFEAIDTVARPDGGHDVYLLSDDNFNLLQRTLLLQFRLEK